MKLHPGSRSTDPMRQPYADRRRAGDELARWLGAYRQRDPLVLGLPRGGVPVAAAVAAALDADLDVLVVRKLGLPRHPELAMGALAGVGADVRVTRNEDVLAVHPVDPEQFDEVRRREEAELRRREALYRGGLAPLDAHGRTVILVDDGLATGSTMLAAVSVLRSVAPQAVVVAVPVAAPDAFRRLAEVSDEVVCPWTPRSFAAVGQAYWDFEQTTDAEVTEALASGKRPHHRAQQDRPV